MGIDVTTSSPSSSKISELQGLRIDRGPRAPQPPNWSRRFILIGIAVVLLLGIVVLAARMMAGSVPEVDTARATPLSSAGPGIALSATGYIVAHHKIDVNSKVTGRVAWIGVEKGDRVKAGQVLVRLENDEFKAQVLQARGNVEAARAYYQQLQTGSRPEEIEQAHSNLEEARATLRVDKINRDRIRALATQGVMSLQQLDDAEARYQSDEQKVSSLSQTYALAKQGPRVEEVARARGALTQAEGQLAYAESQLAATEIRAPVSGTILERTAEKGELMTSMFASAADTGGPRGSAVSLADLNDLQVELDIAQDDFAKLHAREKAVVTTDAYPDRKYNGVLAEISPEANRQKATVQVKVQIQNPDGYLRPDMNATVQFLSDAPVAAAAASAGVLVPANAVHTENGRKFVLVAYDGRAVARDVKLRGQRSDGTLVEGLTGGESVIINAPAEVKDGSRIKQKQ